MQKEMLSIFPLPRKNQTRTFQKQNQGYVLGNSDPKINEFVIP